MVEQELEIKQNEKNGNVYKNINPRELENGNHIIVEKVYPEGLEVTTKFGKAFNCKVKYKDEEVAFFLNRESEHKEFSEAGGVEDKVKITNNKEIKKNKSGSDYVVNNLKFEKVEE